MTDSSKIFILSKLVFITLFCFLISMPKGYGQSRLLEKAQSLIQMNEYAEAIPILEKELSKNDKSYQSSKLLANTYHKLRKFDQAAFYYEQATKMQDAQAEDFFGYGQVLLSQSKPKEAIQNFSTYVEKGGSSFLADMLIESARKVKAIDTLSDRFVIDSLKGINSEYADFGIQLFQDQFYLTSNRKEHFYSPEDAAWTGGDFFNVLTGDTSDLFKSKKVKLKEARGKLNSFYHDGPMSIDNSSAQIALSRIENDMKGKDFVNQMQLYLGEYKKGKWRKFYAFPYNNDAYSLGQAAFADSGKTLYFSSDMPGGYGGMDLYVSYFENGSWSSPKNLGAEINTPLNEVFPFFAYQRLYFSSDGHTTYGGLDILQAEVKYGKWANPQNLSRPINSNADDFSFYLTDPKSGYFASNRLGVVGNDDVFYFQLKPQEKVNLYALFEYKGLPQENIKASLLNSQDSVISVAYSDSKGGFAFKNLPYNEDYLIKLEADDQSVLEEGRFFIVDDQGHKQMLVKQKNGGYQFKSLPVDELKEINRLLANDNSQLVEVDDYLQGSIYSKLPGDLNEKMKVYAISDYGDVIDSTYTDKRGNFAFTSLPADENYLLKISEEEPDLMLSVVNNKGRMVQSLTSEQGYYKLTESVDASKNEDLARNIGYTTLLAKLSNNGEAVPEKWIKIYDKDNKLVSRLLTNQKGEFQYNSLEFDDTYFLEIENDDESKMVDSYDIALLNKDGNPLYLLARLKNGLYELNTLPFDEWQALKVMEIEDPEVQTFVFKGQVYKKLAGDMNTPSVVYAIDDNGLIVDSALTNEKGIFNFSKLQADQSYAFRLKGSNEGYQLVQLDENELILGEANLNQMGDFTFKKLKADETTVDQIAVKDDIATVEHKILSGQVYNQLPGDYGAGIEVLVFNDQGELVGTTYTDSTGKFSFNKLEADGNYFYQINQVEDDVKLITFNDQNEVIERKLNEEYAYTSTKGDKLEQLIEEQSDRLRVIDEEHKAIKNYKVFYRFDHFDLEKHEMNKLDELIASLKASNQSIQLVAHTDNRGSDEYNMALSKKRAEFVEEYLIEHGISKERIFSKYRGESEPYIDCETKDCDELDYRLNRRTEFKVLHSN